jgi:hypothetical protein
MGLDMYLTARKSISNWTHSKPDQQALYHSVVRGLDLDSDDLDGDFPVISVEVPVAYWRKAHQIHDWFVENNQDGEDNCAEYYVSRVSLEALHLLCNQVLDKPELAPEILPLGYSPAVDSYNEWYFEQITNTRDMLRKVLDNPKFVEYDLFYSSSW